MRDASAVIAVSPSILQVLDDTYRIGAKGKLLPNGYEDEELAAVEPVRFPHFAIVYAGQFYPPKRQPKPLLEALARTEVPGWKFHYAGPQPELVASAAAELGMTDKVVLHGNLSRQESLALTAGADVNVVITTVDAVAGAADRGIVTSKIFDAIGLRRPLLVIAPPGSDVETIVRGRTQTACVAAQDHQAIASFIDRIAADGAPATAMAELSWAQLGRRLQAILDEAVRR